MNSSKQHLAAVLPARRAPFVIQERPTPTPGPNEVLIEVKAIALNPIDYAQRKFGFPTIKYPAIIGSDIAGTVVAVGSAVPPSTPQAGARIAAYAPSFFVLGAPDYGAFQTRVLVPAENVTPLPESVSFNEASVLPMAVQTAWSGWRQLGLTPDTAYKPADKKGMLVWGASGSIGCAALQSAKLMGFTVYATASKGNHEYLKKLGAKEVFDYSDEDVVPAIVKAAQRDGVTVEMGYLASGDLSPCIQILQQLKGVGQAKLVVAPFKPALLLWRVFRNLRNTQAQFVAPPADEKERVEFNRRVFGIWLKEKLASGEFVPSPKVRVIDGGLNSVEKGVAEFKAGVRAVKLVLEV